MAIRKQFIQEIQEELKKAPATEGILTTEDLNNLPVRLKAYLEQSGHIGKPKALNCFMVYDHAEIKLKPDRPWLNLDCQQFNAAVTPTRIALLSSKLFGVVPFSGKDKYQNSQGNMLIKLAGFTVTNAKGPQMNKAALVTYLSESVLLPSAMLSQYIKWEEVDSHTLKGTITDAGITVSGLFFFNNKHEVYEFQTEDRYYSQDNQTYYRYKWSALLNDYKMINGYRIPTSLSATWHLPEGDYTYFKGTVKEIKYGIDRLPVL